LTGLSKLEVLIILCCFTKIMYYYPSYYCGIFKMHRFLTELMDVPSISAVSWGTHRLDIFALGAENNDMFHKAWGEDIGWRPSKTEWEFLGGTFSSPPAAVCWGNDRLDIFALGIANDMFHKAWDGDWRPSKTDWHRLPEGRFIGPPAAVSTGERQLDIFALSNYNSMEYNRYNGNRGWDFTDWQFLGWPALGVKFLSPPAAAKRHTDWADVVAIGTDNSLYHKTFNVTQQIPKGWEDIGGTWRSTPAVVLGGYGRLDVFAIGTNNQMYHKFKEGGHWNPSTKGWDRLDGVWFSPPVVVSWGFHRLDVFAIGTNNSLYHISSDDGKNFPGPPQNLGGIWTSPPAVVSWGGHRLDVFEISRENNMYHTASDDGKKFSGWENIGAAFKRFL
jgi:hypothetical protein